MRRTCRQSINNDKTNNDPNKINLLTSLEASSYTCLFRTESSQTVINLIVLKTFPDERQLFSNSCQDLTLKQILNLDYLLASPGLQDSIILSYFYISIRQSPSLILFYPFDHQIPRRISAPMDQSLVFRLWWLQRLLSP